MTLFLNRLCTFLIGSQPPSAAVLADARMAIDDTIAVALAGWDEPCAHAVRAAYAASANPAFGRSGLGAEQEALIQATAAHALDYDDVQLTSITHPSAVGVPALLAIAARRPALRPRVIAAHAHGLAVNVAIGDALGFGHYDRGWHATSSIGPVAATAALAYLLDLPAPAIRSALALAAAQCGGLQRNFGTFAKPVQAGLAAGAAVRAATFAEAGVTADQDVFGLRGYFDLYGDAGASERAERLDFALDAGLISRKLYPCCYATHRMIGAAIAAQPRLVGQAPADLKVTLEVPYGTMRPLIVTDPTDGNEAKFCAAYVTAVALTDGVVSLTDFTTEAVRRPHIRALMERIAIHEAPQQDRVKGGLDQGVVTLSVLDGNRLIAREGCAINPGSPGAPPTSEQMRAKIGDCLAIHSRSNAAVGFDDFRAAIDALV